MVSSQTVVLAVLVVVALTLRWSLFGVVSGDYRNDLAPWYAHLASSGGVAGLADNFGNYNTPYLDLLAALTYLPIDPMVGIKLISVFFDLVLALFAYRIVRVVRAESAWLPTILSGVVLFLPTVVMNGSAWAQCDSIYGSMILASLYFLLTRRPWLAAGMFGIAFAFKLQAIFFLPALVLVLIANRLKLRTLLAAPVVFFVMLLPALAAGRSLLSQLAVYPAQIIEGSGGGGSGHALTVSAPTPYAWLPKSAGEGWRYSGLALVAVVVLAFGVWLLCRRRPLAIGEVVLVAATSTMVIPWLLPQMHERYFFLAETLLVLAIAVDKRMVLPATAIQVASTITYLSYLGRSDLVPLGRTALIGLVAAASASMLMVLRLRRTAGAAPRSAAPGESGSAGQPA